MAPLHNRVAVCRRLALLLALLLSGCAYLPRLPVRGEPEPPLHPPLVANPPAPLPAPEGLRATSGEYRRIPLQWEPMLRNQVGGYRIERAEQREGPFRPLLDVWGRGMVARVDGVGESEALGDGVTHFYRIRAFSPDGRLSEQTSEVVVGTTAPLPSPPAGLQAYSRQPREVPLSWRASDDPHVAGYVIERSPTPDGPFERIAQLDGRHHISYVDAGLGDLRVFYYRVAACNPAGAPGPWSEAVRAVTKPEPLPPLELRVESQLLGANVLTWEPNVEEDIAEYRLFRLHPDAPRQQVASVPASATRARDDSVAADETATYVLVAVDRDGLESRPSERVDAAGTPYAVEADATPERVRLRWDPRTEEGFVGARVVRVGWLGSRVLGNASDGEFIDREIQPGRVYRYVVVLVRPGSAEGPPSKPIEVRVPEPGQAL